MKYLFLKNRMELKGNILKFYFFQAIFLLVYLLINWKSITYFDINKYATFLGLTSINDITGLYIIIKLMSYLVIIYLVVRVFVDSIVNTIEYLMIRINSKKWMFFEILNFIFYVVVMRLSLYLVISILFTLFHADISFKDYIFVIICDLLFSINLLLLIILLLNLFSFNNCKKWLFIFPLLVIIMSLFINLPTIPFSIYIISILILVFIDICLFSPSRFYNRYHIK